MSFSLFAPEIKPKNLLSSLFAPQIKLQFPVQNKTQKWNHHKPNRSSSYQRKNKGIGDGGEVELSARDGEAMKIGVRAVSEVREGEVHRRSVSHDHAWVREGEVRRRSVHHNQFDYANSDVGLI
nr:hypothetical protein CFP56_33167 [Quercus suber]